MPSDRRTRSSPRRSCARLRVPGSKRRAATTRSIAAKAASAIAVAAARLPVAPPSPSPPFPAPTSSDVAAKAMAAPIAQSTGTPFTSSPNVTADSSRRGTPIASCNVATMRLALKQYLSRSRARVSGRSRVMSSHSAPHSASPAAATSATVARSGRRKNRAAWWKFSVARKRPRRGGRYEPPTPQRACAQSPSTPMSRPTAARHAVKFPRGSKRTPECGGCGDERVSESPFEPVSSSYPRGVHGSGTVREPSCGTDARSAASCASRAASCPRPRALWVYTDHFLRAATSSTRNSSGGLRSGRNVICMDAPPSSMTPSVSAGAAPSVPAA